MAIQISGCPVIDNSRNLTNIANATTLACPNTYVLRDANGNISLGLVAQGLPYEGGFLICKSGGGNAWIVAPNTSEVSRDWYLRNDANTRAQEVSGCTGWFVPTISQLQNPGYTCRTYWDSFSSAIYWSSTSFNATWGCRLDFSLGTTSCFSNPSTFCVRAFRCVTY